MVRRLSLKNKLHLQPTASSRLGDLMMVTSERLFSATNVYQAVGTARRLASSLARIRAIQLIHAPTTNINPSHRLVGVRLPDGSQIN